MSLKDVQEGIENKGWRIKRIRKRQGGKAQWVHNSPLSMSLNLLGLAFFLTPLVLLNKKFAGTFEKLSDGFPAGLVIAIPMAIGIGILYLGRTVAARSKFRGWVSVRAICTDHEVRKRKRKRRSSTSHFHVWKLRTLCRFDYGGKSWEATPKCYRQFNSEQQVSDYLARVIDADGQCNLYINPKNPLQAALHELPTVIAVSHDAGNA